ncbi:stress response small protein YobI, partial [Escherichia coli]
MYIFITHFFTEYVRLP